MEEQKNIFQDQPSYVQENSANESCHACEAAPNASITVPEKSKLEQVIDIVKNDKRLWILGGIIIAVIVILIAAFSNSSFENVKSECLRIAGEISDNGDSFTIDTYPEHYSNPSVASSFTNRALDAIEYANKELGFNGSLYTRMLNTSYLMGRQTEENNKYKVSWTYHPSDGLEVTYEKK